LSAAIAYRRLRKASRPQPETRQAQRQRKARRSSSGGAGIGHRCNTVRDNNTATRLLTRRPALKKFEVIGSLIRSADKVGFNAVQTVTQKDIVNSGATTSPIICALPQPTRRIAGAKASPQLCRSARVSLCVAQQK